MSKSSESSVRKISVSLPIEVVNDLDLISHAMGVSRSAFLSGVLVQSLPMLRETIMTLGAQLIEDSQQGDDVMKRYRSTSKDAIDTFMDSLLKGQQHDLFNGK